VEYRERGIFTVTVEVTSCSVAQLIGIRVRGRAFSSRLFFTLRKVQARVGERRIIELNLISVLASVVAPFY
jgi:hypothetical protein